MNDLLRDLAGLEFDTPDDAWAWLDEVNLSDLHKRRIVGWIKKWEADEGQSRLARINAFGEQIAQEHEANQRALEDLRAEAAEVIHLLQTGRIKSRAGRQRLTRLERERQERFRVQETLANAIHRWQTQVDQGLSDHLRERQARFRQGVPHYGKRVLTAAILEGRS